MHIVIIGGSFGGLNVAFDLRRHLPSASHTITVISREPRFVFIPSLPWVAMGTRTLDSISFELEGPLTAKGIEFVEAAVDHIDPATSQVHTRSRTYDYDYLVVATGHRSANEAVPGLGPFDGPGHSLMSAPEAQEARDVRYRTSAAITEITGESVKTADGAVFESRYSLIIPPLAGVRSVAEAPDLGNPKGFIPVDAHFRHRDFANVYAVGVAVALPPVEETPVPLNFPKTGHMTEQMARIAAKNIAADILGTQKTTRELMAECIMDMGDAGAHIVADPVRPPRNVSKFSSGRRWLWAKRFFADYYLWKLRRGANRSPKWVW